MSCNKTRSCTGIESTLTPIAPRMCARCQKLDVFSLMSVLYYQYYKSRAYF